MRKIIVTVAPVAGETPEDVVDPLNPEEIAADVIAAEEAGASMVHLHVRDESGQISEDLSVFSRTLDYIRKESNMIIQGSTGGISSLSLEERCVAINDDRVEVASLNMGSVNMADASFINTLADIRYWAEKIKEKGILPELEVFEGGMINNALIMLEEGLLDTPLYFNFTLGITGMQPGKAENLFYLKSLLPPDSIWGFVHHDMQDLTLLATAIGMGASVIRCGFEDSIFYAPGKKASRNEKLVRKVVKMVNSMGLEVASPQEAREMLQI